ncbi:MAG: RluA family pseudouridine synthase [Hyphomicrobiaceae bacterium]|nr:RluA family pseudouridine synthase [Hyphomicrobiaceae bacterium]
MSDNQTTVIELVVSTEHIGVRVDRFIAITLEDLSRQNVKKILKSGAVKINGFVCNNPKHKLSEGQNVRLDLPPYESVQINAETIPLNITYEDSDIIVVDKPAGLVTHPAPGHNTGTLVNALIAHAGAELSTISGVTRPGIVHRLDKDTSGLMVVAKNDFAHKRLAEQFAIHGTDGRMQRIYTALCWGEFDLPYGTVDVSLARSTSNRRKIKVVAVDKGRHAITHYRVVKKYLLSNRVSISMLRLQLETGRTHQIRVHMSSIGNPVLGDKIYGSGFNSSMKKLNEEFNHPTDFLNRQALHASTLNFEHPSTGQPLCFTSPIPRDMKDLINSLEEVTTTN